MGVTTTYRVDDHVLVVAPDGTVRMDEVPFTFEDWRKLTDKVQRIHEALGLVKRPGHRQPHSLVKPAPLWVRLVTFGQVTHLPGGPSLKGLRVYR